MISGEIRKNAKRGLFLIWQIMFYYSDFNFAWKRQQRATRPLTCVWEEEAKSPQLNFETYYR